MPLSFPGGSVVKNPPASAGDAGSIPGSGRSLGEGNGNPLQYSCLGNPVDRGVWKSTVDGVARVGHNLATKLPPPFLLLTSLFYRFIKLLNILAGVFEFYFGWFFCCNKEKGKVVAKSVKMTFCYFPSFLHHCGWVLLADFKWLVGSDCSPGVNTSTFLVNIWPKLQKTVKVVYEVYFRK